MAKHRFPCPSCGKTLKVDDAMLADIRRRGKGAHCPRCKAPVSVEGLGNSGAEIVPPTAGRETSELGRPPEKAREGKTKQKRGRPGKGAGS